MKMTKIRGAFAAFGVGVCALGALADEIQISNPQTTNESAAKAAAEPQSVEVVAAVATPTQADEVAAPTNTTEVAALPKVVVEASRLGRTAMEMPVAVQLIERGEIAASGARDLASALEKRGAGVNVIRSGAGNPAMAQIAMSGYGENGFGRVLVMVDGEKLNYSDMSAPLLWRIDLGSVERVEVLHGSQCVLHGDAASAGMVNIVSETADYESRARVEAHGGSFDTYGAGASYRGGIEAERVRYRANIGYERSDGYRENNGWDIWNLGGGVGKEWENGSSLKVSAFHNDTRFDLPSYLSEHEWKRDPEHSYTTKDYYRRHTSGFNSAGELCLDDANRARLDFAFSGGQMKSAVYYTGGSMKTRHDLYSFDVKPQWINTAEIFGHRNSLIAGANYRYDLLNGDISGSDKFRLDRHTMAFFAQDTLHLTESLAVEAGGRYQRDWNTNTSLASPTRNTHTFAADLALLFTPFDDFKSYIRLSRFFRNPFLDEVPYLNGKADRILEQETGLNASVGFDWTFLDEFSIGCELFASRTKNEILYEKFIWGNNVNAPCDVVRGGFTANAAWEREKVAGARLGYTFVDAEFDGDEFDGKKVPMSPESTVTATGRLWIWDEFYVHGGYRFLSSRFAYSDFANTGSKLSAFGIFHIGAAYEPEWAWAKGFKVGFIIDNLFDRRYADCATKGFNGENVYYPAAGRSFMLSISYEF